MIDQCWLVRLCVLLMLALCTACGGGGSSQSGGSPPPGPTPIVEPRPPVVNYGGNRQAITVSQDNAARLAYLAFQLRAATQLLENFWIDAPQGPVDLTRTDTGRFGGTADVRAELNANGVGYIELIFHNWANNPADPSEAVNGRYIQRYRPESGSPTGTEFSFAGPGVLEFDNVMFANTNESLSLHGVLRITGVDSSSFSLDLIISDNSSTESLYFEDCTVLLTEKVVNGFASPSAEIAGTVYDHAEGGIDFVSLGPIPFLGYDEISGYIVGGAGGGIELISDGPVTHVRTLSFAFVSVVMDLDGDGSPESARRYSWPAVSGESVFESSVMAGPIANAGNNRSPRPNEPMKLHALFSHDDDGDWLTFEWNIIAKPALSSLTIDALRTDPVLEVAFDVPGDYVFGLRATDGTSASKTALVVRHAPADLGVEGDNATTGGLELGQPVAPSVPILIDGRSALAWPYGNDLPSWHRTGSGISSFQPTGDPASTYFTVQSEGLNEIRFSRNSGRVGVPSSRATINLAVGPTIFETAIELAADANAYEIHKVDVDNDRDDDLVLRVGINGNERIVVLLASPDGLTPAIDVPAGGGELAVGDVNNDGLSDVLSSAHDGLWLFLQSPGNSLPDPVLIEFPGSACGSVFGPTDIALADTDGGGQADIVAIHPCDAALVIWPGNGDGSFGPPMVKTYDNHFIQGMAVGDINGDGRADVVLSLSATSTAYRQGVSIMHAQADGTVVETDFIVNQDLVTPGVSIGDINGDARNDLVILGRQAVDVLLQAADGSLASTTIYSISSGESFDAPVSIVDLNEDGFKDLYFCDAGPSMRLLIQAQDGTFSPVRGPRCTNNGISRSEIATTLDVNGDGHTDLVTLSESARGSIDERALLNIFLDDVHTYPMPDSP